MTHFFGFWPVCSPFLSVRSNGLARLSRSTDGDDDRVRSSRDFFRRFILLTFKFRRRSSVSCPSSFETNGSPLNMKESMMRRELIKSFTRYRLFFFYSIFIRCKFPIFNYISRCIRIFSFKI